MTDRYNKKATFEMSSTQCTIQSAQQEQMKNTKPEQARLQIQNPTATLQSKGGLGWLEQGPFGTIASHPITKAYPTILAHLLQQYQSYQFTDPRQWQSPMLAFNSLHSQMINTMA